MTPDEASTLELRDYLRVLRRHKWIIIVTVIVCMGIGLAMSLTRTPMYQTSARVLVDRRLVDSLLVPTEQRSTTLDADRRRGNQIQVMNSPRVQNLVERELGRPPDSVSISPLEGTDVIQISARGDDPKSIAETVNSFAQTYTEVRAELTTQELNEVVTAFEAQIAGLDQRIFFIDVSLAESPPEEPTGDRGPSDPRLTERAQLVSQRSSFASEIERMLIGSSVASTSSGRVLAEARPPKTPINEDPLRNVLAGLAIGLVLGVSLAFLREYLDDSVKTKEDMERASGLTVVGIVPALADWKKRETTPLISMAAPRSPAAEAYRSVRTSVEFLSLDQPIGSLQVTSASAAEGKTSTLANLAVTFARAGQRVIIVCCDLRRPRVHEFFGLSNRVGFTSMLLGEVPVTTAIQPADRELPIGLVASGPLPPNPAELLASKRAVDAIEELDRRCDLLLIDSPPVLPVTDALVVSGLVDGVLLVASAGSSTRRGVKRATELLRQVDAPLIGGILNGVHSKLAGFGDMYGGDNRYYLESGAPEPKAAVESRNGKGRSRAAARAGR